MNPDQNLLVQEIPPSYSKSNPLIIIDPNIPEAGLLANSKLPNAEILILHPQEDGIQQISDYLQEHQENSPRDKPKYNSLHLLTHGEPGQLLLGKTTLSLENLSYYTPLLRQWQPSSSTKLEILLYGCQVAGNAQGEQFVKELSEITGATLAASRNRTGNPELAGDWQLNFTTGDITAPFPFIAEIQKTYSGLLATFTPGNVTDLKQAIRDANTTPEADTINLAAGTTFSLLEADDFDPSDPDITPHPSWGFTGLPIIEDPAGITIQSTTPGTKATIERGGGATNEFRLFLVQPNAKLTLNDLIVKGGRANEVSSSGDDGGGLLNIGGTVDINNSEIRENFARDDGGGIANVGDGSHTAELTLNNTIVTLNEAEGMDTGDGGGGIENDGNFDSGGQGANLNINGGEITNNTATNGSGGGIRSRDGAKLTINGTNITGNSSSFGAGIAVGDPQTGDAATELAIGNSTVTGNIGGGDDAEGAFYSTPSVGDQPTVTNNGNNTVGTTNIPALFTVPTLEITRQDTGDAIANGGTVDLGLFVLNGSPVVTTFQLTNTGDDPLRLENLSSTGDTEFTLDQSSFQTPIGPNETVTTTTFDITFDPATLGNKTTTVSFDTNAFNVTNNTDPNVLQTFNFTLTGEVTENPPVLELVQLDESGQTVQTLADGGSVNLGTVLVGSGVTSTTFRITNQGQDALTLSNLLATGNSQFSIDGSLQSPLTAGQSTTFDLDFNPTTAGTFQTQVSLETNDPNITNDPFNFAVTATATNPPPEPPPEPPTTPEPPPIGPGSPDGLQVNGGNNIFTFGGVGGSNLDVQLSASQTGEFETLQLVEVDGNNQVISTFNLFTTLPASFSPDGFVVSLQESIFDELQAGDRFSLQLQDQGGEITTFSPEDLQVQILGNNNYSLGFETGTDGSFDDIVVNLNQTANPVPVGVGENQGINQEILDLSNVVGTVEAEFTLYREARFNNVAGLYRLDDAEGTVNGITPGQEGYAQAALENRVENFNLTVANQRVSAQRTTLTGESFYGVFLVANDSVEDFLEDNPENNSGVGPQAYFAFLGANPDQFDHVQLLGNNLFGFEDLPGGGDQDYNDIILKVDIV